MLSSFHFLPYLCSLSIIDQYQTNIPCSAQAAAPPLQPFS
jgi:hypothetical protein